MNIRPAVVCSLLSASVLTLALTATPASGQETLKEANELNQKVIKLYQAGKYAEALPFAQRALELREKALGPDHSDVASSLFKLADLYERIADYAKAVPMYERALAIREKTLASNHTKMAEASLAGGYNNLARLYVTIGNYAKAELLFQRFLTAQEKVFGARSGILARNYQSVAFAFVSMGNYAKAESLYQQALAIAEKSEVIRPNSAEMAEFHMNLARLYMNMGNFAKAEPLYQRALAILENIKTTNAAYLENSDFLNKLGTLSAILGNHAKAEIYYQRALEISEKAPGNLSVLEGLLPLASLYRTMGNYAKAEPLYQRILAIMEKAYGPDHPNIVWSLNDLAILEVAQQHHQDAVRFYKKELGIQDRQIQNVFTITTEEQKLTFIQSISGAYTACLSLIHQHLGAEQETVRDGLELVLRWKGVVFDAQSRAREALQGRLSETARKDWGVLSSLRSELARLLLNKPATMTTDAYKEQLASLQRQIDTAEKNLAGESALVAKELKQRTITVEAVAKSLPKNAALVEFVKIRDFDFSKGKWAQSSRYLAFVLNADGNVTLADLGEAVALEGKARRVLEDIRVSMDSRGLQILKETPGRNPFQQSLTSLGELYTLLWAPLEKPLGGADKVMVSPDGLVNLVPFAALIDGRGRPLVERYQLAYVTSGRELVGAEGAGPKPGSDLLLVANPTFGTKVSGSGSQGVALRSREFRGVFSPLPGTERESEEIPPLVTGKQEQKQVLTGERAQESAVKSARSPRILHLATHGFFLNDEELALGDETRGMGFLERDLTVQAKKPGTKKYENPLVRSGLAFAGANHASEITEGDDGILTALEITGMDLYGTDLVVLSACDTGVGEIKNGEGVFGLRRAFALAGAKNLLMSLWPVSDEITAKQMKAFYTNLQKLPPAEALRQAQLETIKQLKAIAIYGGTAPPGLWAPFILQGAQALGQ